MFKTVFIQQVLFIYSRAVKLGEEKGLNGSAGFRVTLQTSQGDGRADLYGRANLYITLITLFHS